MVSRFLWECVTTQQSITGLLNGTERRFSKPFILYSHDGTSILKHLNNHDNLGSRFQIFMDDIIFEGKTEKVFGMTPAYWLVRSCRVGALRLKVVGLHAAGGGSQSVSQLVEVSGVEVEKGEQVKKNREKRMLFCFTTYIKRT